MSPAEVSAPSLSNVNKVEENASTAGPNQVSGTPAEASRDRSNQGITEQENTNQAMQGIETVTPSEALSTSKTAESTPIKDYSSFTTWEKRFIVLTATIAAMFSPFTAQIYFPALNTIAQDLHVTNSKVNLTVTTYMVCFSHTTLVVKIYEKML